MAKVIRVPLKKAEHARKMLLDEGLIDERYSPVKDDQELLIPIIKKIPGYDLVEVDLPEKEKKITLREHLLNVFGSDELERIKTSYDTVGNIAILEIDRELRDKEKEIGAAVLEVNHNVKTVVRKQGSHEGELRIQKYKHLAGEETMETEVVENGVKLTMDITKVYYSVRSSTERKRVSELVKENERVLVMFSGAGPFICVISKNSPASEVIGVELNEDGHKYAKYNIYNNRLLNAKALFGDVRDIVPRLGKFNRIIMPLPKTAKDFLDLAVGASTKGTWIHLYHFSTEEEINELAKLIPKQLGVDGEVKHIQKCGDLAPGQHRWCLDILIN